MRRGLLACALLALGAQLACARAGDADRKLWLEEFEQLLRHTSQVYANLEWAVHERGVDSAGLAARARAEIGGAGNRRAARKAVERFVEGFADPHFFVRDLDQRAASGGTPPPLARNSSAGDALDFLGFRSRNLDFRIDYERFGDFERVSAAEPFASGVWTLPNGARVGLLRIAHFGEDGYPKLAGPLWDAFAAELEADCDRACQWRFRWQLMNELLGQLGAAVHELRARGIDALLIDVSSNGGGTDWAAIAPRIFAPPLLACPRIGLIRHPHHAERMRAQLASTQQLLDTLQLSSGSRRMLERARDELSARLAAAEQPCDRSALWEHSDAELDCSQLFVHGACGSSEYLAPGLLEELEDPDLVFSPLGFRYEESAWTGPLYVVMDRGTASASEQFLALLEANDAATFLGQRSYGAGCGFIGGGVPAHLPALGITVRMSDCARFRADGRNELDGIEPHVPLDFDVNDEQRAQLIFETLAARVPTPRARDEAAERAALLARARSFSSAFVAKDTSALGELYLEDAAIAPPGRVLRGRAAIRRWFAPVEGRRQLAHRVESRELRFDGDSVLDRGDWISTVQRGDAPPDSARGPYTIIWRRDERGEWKIAIDVWR